MFTKTNHRFGPETLLTVALLPFLSSRAKPRDLQFPLGFKLLIWLLRDIDLFSTLLRAANLSFEALLLGGVIFLLAVALPASAGAAVESLCLRGVRRAAIALAVSESLTILLASASLLGDTDLHLRDVLHAGFFLAGTSACAMALLLWWAARAKRLVLLPPASVLLLMATVSTSHAVRSAR